MVSKINLITILIVWFICNASLGQTLSWEYIPKNTSLGLCVSSSECDSLTFCYGLKYTPSVSGKITSYTLGFQGNCPGGGTPYLPALSGSCIMADNTDFINGCGTPTNMFLLQASGNSGNDTVYQGQPIFIHQICFEVNPTDTLIILEDIITQLTLSIDSLVNNQPITEVLTFSPFEINYEVCDSTCLTNQYCSFNFDVSNPGFNIDTLPGGSIANAESFDNSSPFAQGFDIWDEVGENCRISGGMNDMLMTFSVINTQDVNSNIFIDSLAGPMHRIIQNARGISGEIPFNINDQNESSSGDIRGYAVEVAFAAHIDIIADQISVLLDSINSKGEVFESAYLVFLDENLMPYSSITHHGYFDGEADLTGDCDTTLAATVYTASAPGVFFADNSLVVSLANPCEPANGVDGPSNVVTVNARYQTGLDSMDKIGGFRIVVFGEDVAAADSLDMGVLVSPDDGLRANRKTKTAGLINSALKGFTVTGCVFNAAPTPVTWSNLEAEQKNHEVELTWSTASELNNDFFSIEWSTDGIHFYKIGQVSSKGNSTRPNEYMFMHLNPQSGINYYKIRQTDYDGKYAYSRTVKVLINKSESNASFVIHPNPTGSELNVLVKENYSNENKTMEWFNPKGQLIKTIILDQNVSHRIDVTDLAAGPYILMMKSNQNVEVKKFIKM
ncbi:MAG: T9SS type A sorting domain-containing protein [Saprospiraceae bacterium]|nr:T9SS type A sorting domain-containing protein [Saprospiraceae bacterium]